MLIPQKTMESKGMKTYMENEQFPKVLTVTQLNLLVKELLESTLGGLWVEGEISNFSSPFSGHWYFILKDEQSSIRCVMFKQQTKIIKFLPQNGMKVLVKGDLNVYLPRGEYQIHVDYIEPLGIGALALAFEQLKTKLKELGLFDPNKKKPIPYLPKKVAVITSPTGAAIRDFLKVIRRRFADIHIIVVPVRVQGDEATKEIVDALRLVNEKLDVDVIVITRGGGSLEDLWPFNQEELAYAIRESKIPVVSAVGHEIDWTICDMASDLRAPTPSAAAEILVKEKVVLESKLSDLRARLIHLFNSNLYATEQKLKELTMRLLNTKKEFELRFQYLDELSLRLQSAILHILSQKSRSLLKVKGTLISLNPKRDLDAKRERIKALKARLLSIMLHKIKYLRAELQGKKSQIEGMSPLNVLKRGYSITFRMRDGKIVRSYQDIDVGEEIKCLYAKGMSISIVTSTKHTEPFEELL